MSLHPHARVAKSCNPMEHSLPDSAHGLCQAWILEWGCHFLLHAPVFSALFFLCFCNLASDTFYTFFYYSWPLNNMDLNLVCLFTRKFFSINTVLQEQGLVESVGVNCICRGLNYGTWASADFGVWQVLEALLYSERCTFRKCMLVSYLAHL